MVTRRNRSASLDAFEEQDRSLEAVDGALFGRMKQADGDRVLVRPINPDNVIVDPDIQVRTEGLNPERVELLVQVLLNGGDFRDPIDTCRLDGGPNEILADGAHRLEAYRQARQQPDVMSGHIILPPLKSRSHPGGKTAALEIAEDGNLKHGEPLTAEDKKNLLWRRWTRVHPWASLSDREIARQLGVTHTTIRRWKEEFMGTNGTQIPLRESHEKKIVTKTGQTRDVAGVKKANQKRSKAGPTTTQIKRSVIKHLRMAIAGLYDLEDQGVEEVERYVSELAREWGIK